MKKKSEAEEIDLKDIQYQQVIKSVKSVESYFNLKYNKPYLNWKNINNIELLRKKKYPNYESLKLEKKLELIKETNLKNAIKKEIEEINSNYSKGGKYKIQTKLELFKEINYITDVIILKEIQEEEEIIEKGLNQEKAKLNNLKKELLKRQKKISHNYNQELEDMCIYGNILKAELKEEKRKNPEKFIEIKKALKSEKNDKESFALGLFAYNLQQKGYEVAIEKDDIKKEEDLDEDATCLQFVINSLDEKKKYELHFDFGEQKNNEFLNNGKKFNELKEKLKIKISKVYKIPKEEIIITYPQKGSLSVQLIFERDEFNNLNLDEFKKKFRNDKDFPELENLKEIHTDVIIGACKLNKNQLDSRGNRIDGWGENEQRGNMDYHPPSDWIGIGLRVLDKYDNGNNDWIGMENKKGEWCVAYHGVGRYQNSEEVKKITGAIYKSEFKPGKSQVHEDHDDINHPGKKVGNGVYCTPFVEVAESYSGICNINGESYKTVLMTRVKPSAIRTCEDQKDYWVVSGTKDEIRPYRILYKRV